MSFIVDDGFDRCAGVATFWALLHRAKEDEFGQQCNVACSGDRRGVVVHADFLGLRRSLHAIAVLRSLCAVHTCCG
jgi:hypothetical protein